MIWSAGFVIAAVRVTNSTWYGIRTCASLGGTVSHESSWQGAHHRGTTAAATAGQRRIGMASTSTMVTPPGR